MKQQKVLKIFLTALIVFLFSACGSNSDSTTTSDDSSNTGIGYYVDSAIAGVDYLCSSQKGITDRNGKFIFEQGKDCKLELAGILLRKINSNDLYEQVKIFENNIDVARFLQSIDFDGNASNGIKITKSIQEALFKMDLSTVPVDNDLIDVINQLHHQVNGFNGIVKTQKEVIHHLNETKIKELLSGKTFYAVGQDVINKSDIWGGKVVFNQNLTNLNYTYDTRTVENNSIKKIDGNKLIWLSDNSYTIVGTNKGDYIEFDYHNSDGSLRSNTRLYFSKIKADAYINYLKSSVFIEDSIDENSYSSSQGADNEEVQHIVDMSVNHKTNFPLGIYGLVPDRPNFTH